MTHISAAAAANVEQEWPKTLRITEASVGFPASQQSVADRAISKLRAGLASLHAAWRWMENKRSQQIASKRLRVAETISLGEKRTISIVTVDGAQFLIGSSSNGVQLLTRLDQPSTECTQSEVSR